MYQRPPPGPDWEPIPSPPSRDIEAWRHRESGYRIWACSAWRGGSYWWVRDGAFAPVGSADSRAEAVALAMDHWSWRS